MPSHDSRSGPVVRYRPDGVVALTFFLLILLAGSAMLVTVVGVLLRTTHVRCDRAAGTCAIVASWGPLESTRTVQLASIAEARLVTERPKRDDQYSVVFVLKDGQEVWLSNAQSTDPSRMLVQQELAGFLADASRSAVDVTYESWNPFAVFPLAFAFVLPYLATLLLQSAEVWVDGDMLRVRQKRWPRAAIETSFALRSVHGARVSERFDKGKKYAVALDVQGNEGFLLVDGASSDRGPSERAVVKIQRLLAGSGGEG